jgi:hypothetical protein
MLSDGPGREALRLGMFNPVVDNRARVVEVRIISDGHRLQEGNWTVFGIETPAVANPMRVNLWLRSWNDPDKVLLVQNYDVRKRTGECAFRQHPWTAHAGPPPVLFRHGLVATNLMSRFFWEEGGYLPITLRGPIGPYASDVQRENLPFCAVKTFQDEYRWDLYLMAVKLAVGTGIPGGCFRFEAVDRDDGTQAWSGYLNLDTKDGSMWPGRWPRERS